MLEWNAHEKGDSSDDDAGNDNGRRKKIQNDIACRERERDNH